MSAVGVGRWIVIAALALAGCGSAAPPPNDEVTVRAEPASGDEVPEEPGTEPTD